ncbi:MAG: exo-alpha-sialidase [Acidimicrobiia bacterium]|nr:exo-alpha-sialidase [Acidimicrobiia bacterium]
MKITRREFAKATTTGALLPWLPVQPVGLSAATPSLPDYGWIVEEQRIILRHRDLGQPEQSAVYPHGLTFAKNGDLLMAASCAGAGKTFIMRSRDRGKTWTQQSVLEHKVEGEYTSGLVESMSRTRSGRLVASYCSLKQEQELTKPGWPYYVPQGNNYRFSHVSSNQWGVYSDDEGITWRYVPMDISPFKSFDPEASTQIFEEQDGTLVTSFRGHLTQEELDAGISSVGVIRSRDAGLSWGDANPIVRGQPGSGLWYNESQLLPLPDGRWLCMVRLNNNNFKDSPLTMCRSYSHDRGHTWTYPVRTQFRGGEPGLGFLPDGAVVAVQTNLRTWMDDLTRPEVQSGLLYEVSYNSGLTWSYWGPLYLSEPGSREHRGSPIVRSLDAETAIAVYHRGEKEGNQKIPGDKYGPQFIGASWLRKVAAADPRASKLRYR